ncbi:hypothetical protein QNI16_38105 [Cytophagaceae bacterium YF14B1]|uniref:Uncharacterized protein n=1 Tax=Xanthocytophaga flava TaxID=3048013 RepID=A0AAE3R009_9BACT|nr:hypothetical protein [Xanthocytophaga flavus]MDJ1486356.1 hypothetical protein [Xanthocytophaga flavus]
MAKSIYDYIQFVLDNWKTSTLGLFTFSGYLLWVINRIDTQSFVSLLAFISTVGFFSMRDPK